jgi:hypothetical protein
MTEPVFKECGMFRTPESMQEITDWIESHPKETKASLWTVAMMVNNLAAKEFEKLPVLQEPAT